ncbi:unnamed protein product [Camellia sinensis]
MTTLFSLPSSSSAFLSSPKNPSNQTTFPRNKQTLHFKTHLSVNSLLSPESDLPPPPAIQTIWQWLSGEAVISSKSQVKPGIVPEGLGLVATNYMALVAPPLSSLSHGGRRHHQQHPFRRITQKSNAINSLHSICIPQSSLFPSTQTSPKNSHSNLYFNPSTNQALPRRKPCRSSILVATKLR